MHRRSVRRTGVAIALLVGVSVLPLSRGSAQTHGRPASTGRPPARVVSLDPELGSLRAVVRPGGFLSGPSNAAPRAVALGFLRRHRAELGVTTEQLRSLDPPTEYVDILGTHHLAWTQSAHGIRVFHAGVRAAVSNDGRLVTVTGPLASGTSRARATFRHSPGAALAAARRSVGASAKRHPLDRVERIWFATARGLRPAYRTQTAIAADRIELAIVDARSARVLWHTNLVQSADQVGSGLAWPYYPSSLIPGGGGTQAPVTFPVADATALSGNNAHVFTDVAGRFRFRPKPEDEIEAADAATLDWSDPAQLDTSTVEQHCSAAFACTWNSEVPRSWRANRRASATNTYWLLNHFHDHLQDAPIGFTEAAGNFQVVNDDGAGGLDGDPVMAASLLGAGLRHGLPVFMNNAFMGTPPDGQPPSMGMFLFEEADYPAWYPFGPEIPSTDAGVDASVVYHEYTHGLSNRLVIYPDGESALGAEQSYAMGEAWSDWYGLDLLTREGSIVDTPAVDVVEGRFVTGGPGIRFQAADCDVDSSAVDCPAPKGGAGPGGYTYGDYGQVFRGPESHSDGEIWVQTLWDLRQAVGSNAAEMLVTRAMELSPPNPSYLDMRNAILDADMLAFAGNHVDEIWTVFAGRGMGFFAESLGGDDGSPLQDFSLPPTCPGDVTCGRIEGTVTDRGNGGPLAGATVRVSGIASGIPVDLSATTGADGSFTVQDVPYHTYDSVIVSAPGFDVRTFHDVTVSGTTELSTELERDWAALSGGATIESFRGSSRFDDCSVSEAFDGDASTAWVAKVRAETAFVTIRLPSNIDIERIGLSTTGCLGFAGLKRFTILTRTGHGDWKRVIQHDHALSKGGVTYFRLQRGEHRVRALRAILREGAGRHPYSRRFVQLGELIVRGSPAA